MRKAQLIFGFINLITCALCGLWDTKIPIGGVFDVKGKYTQMAINRKKHLHNSVNFKNYQFRIDFVNQTTDISDSYALNASVCGLVSRGICTLFTQGNQTSQVTTRSITEELHIPHIMTSSSPEFPGNNQTKYQVMMAPSYINAIVDIIIEYKWRKAHYVYVNDKGLIELESMQQQFTTRGLNVTIDAHRLYSWSYAYQTLRRIDKWDAATRKCLILDTDNSDEMQQLLKQVVDVGMNRQGYHHILSGVDIWEVSVDSFRFGGARITGFSALKLQSFVFQNFVRKWDSVDRRFKGKGLTPLQHESAMVVDALDLLVNAMTYLKEHKPDVFKELGYNNKKNHYKGLSCQRGHEQPFQHGDDIMDAIKNVKPFPGMTGNVKIGPDGRRVNYSLQVVEVSMDREAEITNSWSDTDGLSKRETDTGDQKSVKSKIQIVSMLVNPPYWLVRTRPLDSGKPPTGNDLYEGYCKDLLEEIASSANFQYTLKPAPDKRHGDFDPTNRSWDGMIGEVANGRAHLAVGDLTIISPRERVVDFSKPFMTLGISIMIMKPQKQKPGVFSFMDPLHHTVWLCIVGAYICVSLVLFVTCKFSPYEESDDFTLYNSLWFSLGCFMQQGADIAPSSISGRSAAGVWWICSLIIIASYTANLAAFLTIEKLILPVESADELSRHSEISYGILRTGATRKFFDTSKVTVFKKMSEQMKASNDVFVDSIEEGVQRVRESKGKYAFLLDEPTNDYHNQKLPCNTMKVGNNLDSKGFGVACSAHNAYRNAITLAILRMKEDGTLRKFKTRWWYDKGECGPPDGDKKESSMSPLTLSNVSGVFYILVGGLGLSMVMSVVEIVYKSKLASRKKKTSFKSALKANSRLSVRGGAEEGNPGLQYSPAIHVMSSGTEGTQTNV